MINQILGCRQRGYFWVHCPGPGSSEAHILHLKNKSKQQQDPKSDFFKFAALGIVLILGRPLLHRH